MQTVVLSNLAILTLVDVDFSCPACTKAHTENDWYPKYQKSKNGLIYMKCKGCKSMLGVTTCITGDVKVWLKKEEKNL